MRKLCKSDFERLIGNIGPVGQWHVSETSCGLLIYFSNEIDRVILMKCELHKEINCPVQVAKFTNYDLKSGYITGWARKAQSNSMQMIPVPADPFSLPYAIKSDPLRSPVFVPLNTECLMGSKSYLFEGFPKDTWAQRLVLFQEEVAYRFGFMTCVMEKENEHHHHQYIHLSGNVFLMVPSMPCKKPQTRTALISSRSKTIRKYAPVEEEDVAASPHHQYITRHVGFEEYGLDARVGFLWSWNHMVSRRWKWSATVATSDEAFQNKLLSDFRLFCSNDCNRLRKFWDDCWIQAKLNG